MSSILKDDLFIEKLRREHPKSGPDPQPGEPLDIWAERFMKYVRQKHGLEEKVK